MQCYIIVGLIAGYLSAKMFSGLKGGRLLENLNHVKALVAILSAIGVAVIVLSGSYERESVKYLSLFLSCMITFYFGSKNA